MTINQRVIYEGKGYGFIEKILPNHYLIFFDYGGYFYIEKESKWLKAAPYNL
jgi:hypothetical protein